jgi:hypothetical protein
MAADLARRNMYLIGWIANRANNSMLTDPVFAPGIFNAANGYEGNFTTTPGLDLRKPDVFAHFKNRLRDGYVKRGMRGFKIDRGEQGEMPAGLQNELAIPDREGRGDLRNALAEASFVERLIARENRRRLEQRLERHAGRDVRSLKQLLRLGPIVSMVGSDTGGYGRSQNAETFARWLALSAASPMMSPDRPDRTRGTATTPDPMPTPDLPIARTVHPGAPRFDPCHPVARHGSTPDWHAGDADDAAAFPDDPAVAACSTNTCSAMPSSSRRC